MQLFSSSRGYVVPVPFDAVSIRERQPTYVTCKGQTMLHFFALTSHLLADDQCSLVSFSHMYIDSL
jgi:hypothetical protein